MTSHKAQLLVFSLVLLMLAPAVGVALLFAQTADWDNENNGFIASEADFTKARKAFDDIDVIKNTDAMGKPINAGLGPTYNAQSCRECHQNSGPPIRKVDIASPPVPPVSGSASQIMEHRAGFYAPDFDFGPLRFHNPTVRLRDPDGKPSTTRIIQDRNLINDRAICPNAQERLPEIQKFPLKPSGTLVYGIPVHTNRISLSIRGDGFIEAIANHAIRKVRDDQCALGIGICGIAIRVPILEWPHHTRIGRFGWKDQHASLLSFAADAYLNEMGISNDLQPHESTDVCNHIPGPKGSTEHDIVPVPNDDEVPGDIDLFAAFMRSTKVPPQTPVPDFGTNTCADTEKDPVLRGRCHFIRIKCAVCHTETFKTVASGTVLVGDKTNPRRFEVNDALGNKEIHPYSDFLLHDIGTGDFIPLDPQDRIDTRRAATESHMLPRPVRTASASQDENRAQSPRSPESAPDAQHVPSPVLGEVAIAPCEHYSVQVTERFQQNDIRKLQEALNLRVPAASREREACNFLPALLAFSSGKHDQNKFFDKEDVCRPRAFIKREQTALNKQRTDKQLKDEDIESILEDAHILTVDLQCTARLLRTPPLWGVHMRSRLIHDGLSFNFRDAIMRHRGEAQAAGVRAGFIALSEPEKEELFSFLDSLGLRPED